MKLHPMKFPFIRQAPHERRNKLIKELKVKDVTALSYDRTGKTIYDGKPTLVEKYDSDGILLESFRHEEDFIDEKVTTSIDAKGNRIKIISYEQQDFYTYNQEEKLIEIAIYTPGKRLKSKSRFQYETLPDSKEQCIEINRCGRLAGKSITTFNDQKLIDSIVYYNNRGYPYSKVKYYYDDLGKLLKQSEISSLENDAGMPKVLGRKPFCVLYVDEFRYHYDEQGNLIEKIKHSIEGTIDWNRSESYKYDELGRLAQEINYDRDGATLNTVVYKYDSNGWIISKELINPMRKPLFAEVTKYYTNGLEKEKIKEDFEEFEYCKEIFSYCFHDETPLI